jgi:cation-transporting ATPase 13A3/4/5
MTQVLFLYLQVLNPFYVFQAFTLTLWLSQGYVEYSVAIIILTFISIVLSVYDLQQVRAEIIVGFYLASG